MARMMRWQMVVRKKTITIHRRIQLPQLVDGASPSVSKLCRMLVLSYQPRWSEPFLDFYSRTNLKFGIAVVFRRTSEQRTE